MEFNDVEEQLSEEDYTMFVTNLEVILPEDYKTHILECNGGIPKYKYINEIRIHYFHAIKYSDYSLEEVLANIKDILPRNFFQ